MAIIIRPETVADYATIAAVNARAFGFKGSEPLMVSFARHRAGFDPELSLVVEVDNCVVGHALFTRQVIRLLGEDVPAVLLGPIAVDPAHQDQGLGGALIVEGHNVARAKGYTLSFLVGHPTYYPRFGYRTHVFGDAHVTVVSTDEPAPLATRFPTEADVPALGNLWLREEGGVDFAIHPGGEFMDWSFTNPLILPAVYVREGEIVGYTRIHRNEPLKPRLFLARDADVARAMVNIIAGAAGREVTLPLHPYSASAAVFDTKPTVRAWDAAMAHRLAEGLLDEFIARLEFKQRLPGRPVWPVMFDVENAP
ncbi:MAG: N-acetyltransferase [Chloroflexi bacterium]|nr:N-acetyltransferase [Chloroflexota bacterium]